MFRFKTVTDQTRRVRAARELDDPFGYGIRVVLRGTHTTAYKTWLERWNLRHPQADGYGARLERLTTELSMREFQRASRVAGKRQRKRLTKAQERELRDRDIHDLVARQEFDGSSFAGTHHRQFRNRVALAQVLIAEIRGVDGYRDTLPDRLHLLGFEGVMIWDPEKPDEALFYAELDPDDPPEEAKRRLDDGWERHDFDGRLVCLGEDGADLDYYIPEDWEPADPMVLAPLPGDHAAAEDGQDGDDDPDGPVNPYAGHLFVDAFSEFLFREARRIEGFADCVHGRDLRDLASGRSGAPDSETT